MTSIVTLDYQKARNPMKFWACGDFHVGHVDHVSGMFTRHFERAVDEKWVVLHVGDALELVTPGSKVAMKGALADQVMPIETQRKALGAYLQRLNGGVLLPGNHEWRIDAVTGLDFMQMMNEIAGSKYQVLEIADYVRINVGKQTYWAFIHHGEGTTVNIWNLHEKIMRDVEGLDFILCGHIHQSANRAVSVRTPDGPRTVQWFRTGHYLQRADGAPPRYASVRPVGPQGAPGSWLLTLDPTHHRITSEWLD